MNGLKVNFHRTNSQEFYFSFNYDATKYKFPFPIDGIEIYLNDDANPLVELVVAEPKKYEGKVDFGNNLPAGSYKITVKTKVITIRGHSTSCFWILKAGDFIRPGIYDGDPGNPPPPLPPFPGEPPELDKYREQMEKEAQKILWEVYTDIFYVTHVTD